MPDGHPLQLRAATDTIGYAKSIQRYNPKEAQKYYWHLTFERDNAALIAMGIQAEYDGVNEMVENNPHWALNYATHILLNEQADLIPAPMRPDDSGIRAYDRGNGMVSIDF